MRRYVLTGTPGAGKTSILRGLAERGYDVVEEAATAVIGRAQAQGDDAPWERASFIDEVVALQRARQVECRTAGSVQVFDRSPVCTHALATYLGRPVTKALVSELERIAAERVYEPQVFFVRNLGFCTPTAARRISFRDSLAFERIHEASYRSFGYEFVHVPAGDVDDRVDAVDAAISRLVDEPPVR